MGLIFIIHVEKNFKENYKMAKKMVKIAIEYVINPFIKLF